MQSGELKAVYFSRFYNSLFVGWHSHKDICILFLEVNCMDQIKIGKFIAELRRKNGLTQEAFGEKIGVTNKTVSRWENGNYMPDIEMLSLIAKEFDVTINELLAGQVIADADFRSIADENILQVARTSSFSFEEKKKYFKNKWRREHIGLFVLLAIILIGSFVLPVVLQRPGLVGLTSLIALLEYSYQNNLMMAYVEKSIYGK